MSQDVRLFPQRSMVAGFSSHMQAACAIVISVGVDLLRGKEPQRACTANRRVPQISLRILTFNDEGQIRVGMHMPAKRQPAG